MTTSLAPTVLGWSFSSLCHLFVRSVLSDGVAIPHAEGARAEVGQIVPKTCALPIGHAVLTVVNVAVGHAHNTFLILKQSSLRILHYPPRGRLEVVEDVQGPLDNPVGLLNLSGAHSLCSTVLGAGRRGPDEIEVSRREGVLVVPVQDVAVDVRG